MESCRRVVEDNDRSTKAGCSKSNPKGKAKAKRITKASHKAECKEYRRILTSLFLNNPLSIKPKKSHCKLFSLEECSDIEPISEDDEVDEPICEVQPFSIVPRVFGTSTYDSYPCIEKKSEDWALPPLAKKYVEEVMLQEWTDYNSEKPDALAGVSKKRRRNIKKELLSEAMEFVTTTIHDRVMSRRVVDETVIKNKGSK